MTELTDEQVVQTLKYCSENSNCKGCMLFAEDSCSDLLKSNALDLINRLKADNKRLWEDCDYFEEKAKTAKTEACKEFAERLKALYTRNKTYDRPNPHTSLDYLFANIDKILKEMVGEV